MYEFEFDSDIFKNDIYEIIKILSIDWLFDARYFC